MTIKSKVCTGCKEDKLLEEFYKHKAGKYGRPSKCKICMKEYKAKYYANNPEKMKERASKYRANNPEKVKEYKAKYRANNREKLKEQSSKYRTNNPEKIKEHKAKYYTNNHEKMKERASKYRANNLEKIKERSAKYYANNAEKVAAKAANRRIILGNATVAWRDDDKIREIYKERDRLTKETGIVHHVDHIIPLKGKNVTGLHHEDNLQILTATENLRKGNAIKW